MTWLSFQLAAEEVERRLGVTWGAAQRQVFDLCESGTVEWRQRYPGGPDVSRGGFRRWLENKLTRKVGGKQSRIRRLLAEMFPAGVPHRGDCPREPLKAELLERDPGLKPLDLKTLKTAIDAYNRQLGNARNTSVSD
jgi:hypothetical protein